MGKLGGACIGARAAVLGSRGTACAPPNACAAELHPDYVFDHCSDIDTSSD